MKIDDQILDCLSIDYIRSLISPTKAKEELIEEIKSLNNGRLSENEISQLSMLTTVQLFEIVKKLTILNSKKKVG